MLAVVYLLLTAKPISLRRLLLLFMFALIAANLVFAAFQVRHGPHAALATAAGIILLAWSTPLVRLAYGAIRFHMLMPNALAPASGFIVWTYGFALAFAPMLAICALTNRAHEVPLGILARLAAAAFFVGTLLPAGLRSAFLRGIAPHGVLRILSHGDPVYLTTGRSHKIPG
jgi:hypothetical protein